MPDGEMKSVARVFDLAKQDVAGYEAYAEQLATMFKGNRKVLEDVLEGCSTSPRPTRRCIRARSSFGRVQALRHDRNRIHLH